jgi:hypothetical protein
MIKKISVVAVMLALLVGGVVYIQFNKEHRDIEGESASIEITAIDLFDSYVTDEKEANSKYLDRVIAVTGRVSEMVVEEGTNLIVLKTNDDFFGVNASFDDFSGIENLMIGKELTIKGRCTGGDEMVIVLTNCTVVKK